MAPDEIDNNLQTHLIRDFPFGDVLLVKGAALTVLRREASAILIRAEDGFEGWISISATELSAEGASEERSRPSEKPPVDPAPRTQGPNRRNSRSTVLLDQLVSRWTLWDSNEKTRTWYLTKLAPKIVAGTAQLPPTEARLVEKLKESLSGDQWFRLPELIDRTMVQLLEVRRNEQVKAQEARDRTRLSEEARRQRIEAKRLSRQEEARRRTVEIARRERQEADAARLLKKQQEQFRREAAILEARRQKLDEMVRAALLSDFLSVDTRFAEDFRTGLLTEERLNLLKSEFVREWARRELDVDLDLEQASAVSVTKGDVRVTARAGSGKTRTLTVRAAFLQTHCGVDPSELLQGPNIGTRPRP